MKALILAGGRGKRLDEYSENRNKCMLSVRCKPVIEFSLDNAVKTKVDEIIIVVGYRAEDIINYYGNHYKDKTIKYVIQWEQKGLVHAIEYAKDAIGKDDFILMLGDEILINPRHQQMIDRFNARADFVTCGLVEVDDKEFIKKTYTIIKDDSENIFRLIEKPRLPLNNLMGTGDCVFNNKIFSYIDVTPIHHTRNEKELPDLIQCAIDDGMPVRSFIIGDKYTNINCEDDIKIAEQIICKG
ncbi:MAG: nucleotidyltransferase family protein [bacterium]